MYKEKSQNKKFVRECGSRDSQRARQQRCDDTMVLGGPCPGVGTRVTAGCCGGLLIARIVTLSCHSLSAASTAQFVANCISIDLSFGLLFVYAEDMDMNKNNQKI
jgi:hypothetical protein